MWETMLFVQPTHGSVPFPLWLILLQGQEGNGPRVDHTGGVGPSLNCSFKAKHSYSFASGCCFFVFRVMLGFFHWTMHDSSIIFNRHESKNLLQCNTDPREVNHCSPSVAGCNHCYLCFCLLVEISQLCQA